MTTIVVRDANGQEISVPIGTDPTTSAKQDQMISAFGTTGDSAWTGSGVGAVIGVLKGIWNAVSGKGLAASGKTSVTGVLVSNTNSDAFFPLAGRDFYLELTGAGTVTGTVVYLCNDGITYAPNVVATDGGVPITVDKIAYNGGVQNGVRVSIQVSQASMIVKFSPGSVVGPVNYAFVQ